jgi:flagellar biosynthesis/type III secretory pathway M-ring protein FliF/YscJ
MRDSRLSKLHLHITIVAALIVTVICIVRQETLYVMSIWLSLTIVVFYCLGQVIRLYIAHLIEKQLQAEAEAQQALMAAEALTSDDDEIYGIEPMPEDTFTDTFTDTLTDSEEDEEA